MSMESYGVKQSDLAPENPYISQGSSLDWPTDLPRPRVLFPRTHRLPPSEHLDLVCHVERTGIVGDVIFDLRHPTLDPVDWRAESLLRIDEDRRRRPFRPFLWFPWYGEHLSNLSTAESRNIEASQTFRQRGKALSRRNFAPNTLSALGIEFRLCKSVMQMVLRSRCWMSFSER